MSAEFAIRERGVSSAGHGAKCAGPVPGSGTYLPGWGGFPKEWRLARDWLCTNGLCEATHDMTPEFAIELIKTMMFQAVALAAPALVAGRVVGLAISLFQAVTSIHEQTLTFVPKALAVVAVLVLLLPWILRTLVEFTTAIIEKMPQMGA